MPGEQRRMAHRDKRVVYLRQPETFPPAPPTTAMHMNDCVRFGFVQMETWLCHRRNEAPDPDIEEK